MTLKPPGDDWIPGLLDNGWPTLHPGVAPNYLVLELWRREWGNETSFLRQSEINPAMNLAGLWWRPA